MASGAFATVVTEEGRTPLREIRSLPPGTSVAALEALRKSSIPQLQDLIAQITAATGLKSEWNEKKTATAEAKIKRPEVLVGKPWLELAHLRDFLRFRTRVMSLDDFEDVFDVFVAEQNAGRLSIVKIDTGKLLAPKEFGWRMVAIDLRLSTNMLVEHYMTFDNLIQLNEDWLHKVFERWRGRTTITTGEIRARERDASMSTAANRDAFVRVSLGGLSTGPQLRSVIDQSQMMVDRAISGHLGL